MSTKENLVLLVNLIINQYFNSECVLQLSNKDFLYLNSTMNMLVSSDKIFNKSGLNHYDQCKDFFIYKSHNPRQSLENIERFIRMDTNKLYSYRKYIIFINKKDSIEFNELFESSALKFITNLLVITKETNKSKQFSLFTHKYIGKTNNNEVMLLDTWNINNNSFTNGNNLFPDKIDNQHGRVISVTAGSFIPHSYIENQILIEYANTHNATLSFDRSKQHLGEIYPNWTGGGILQAFIEDRADLVSFGLYTHRRWMFGDLADSISSSQPTCLVPKPTKRDRWMIIHLFHITTWLITLTVYVVLLSVNYLFNNFVEKPKKTKKHMNYLTILRTAFAQPNKFTRKNHSKAIMSPILIGVFLIHNFFTSKLAVKLIKPTYENNIETLKQLAKSELKWYSEYDGVAEYYEHEKNEPYATLYQNFRIILADQIDTIEDEQFAYVVDVSRHRFYSIEPYFTLERLENFKLMRENLMFIYTSILFRRNSVLIPSFNKLLGNVMSYGLIKFWEFEAIYSANDSKRQLYVLKQFEDVGRFAQLDLQELRGVFIMGFCGICVSMIVFLLELFKKI